MFLEFAVCTPLGFIRLFGVVGQVLVKPHLMRDVNEEYHASYLEEASILRKIENLQHTQSISLSSSSSIKHSTDNTDSSFNQSIYCDIKSIPKTIGSITDALLRHRYRKVSSKIILNHKDQNHQQPNNTNNANGVALKSAHDIYNNVGCDELHERLRELKSERTELDKLRSSTAIQRNLIYPLAMLMLLFLTGITVLVVVQNTLELLIGIKALPLSTRVN